MRAKLKLGSRFLAAPRAGPRGLLLERALMWPSTFIKDLTTAVAFQEAFSSLDRNEGDEEEAHIMVKPLEPG